MTKQALTPDSRKLKRLLDEKAALYNRPEFIARDPVSVPHRFQKRQDIEIAGLFAAVLAWGNRTAIINNTNRIMAWMQESPYDFICNHRPADLKPMLHFAHRTFNATDLLYFIELLRFHYRQSDSLETAFVPGPAYDAVDTGAALVHFHRYFFALEHPERTRKHIATPERKSACKRLNMLLRWMVRRDNNGVDFGLWQRIRPAQLICPLDVHVARVATRFGLLPDERSNWQHAVLLTEQLRNFNPEDPAVYDYALFGLGAEERF